MTIETDFNDALDGFAGLSALVSDRNYVAGLPQNPTYPNTVTSFDRDIQNNLVEESALEHVRVQVDCRAKRYGDVSALVVQVKAAIAADTRFKSRCLSANDIPYEQGVETFRIVVRFSVWQC